MTKSGFRAVAVVAALCGASRFLAMARSMWDWDEALFCLAMRSYDVAAHHPHPPGYPVFIAMAKAARWAIHDDFCALQSVNLLAGVFLFPAVFLLAREAGLRLETSIVGGVLCVFFPNVWFFGGTAFSDIASLTVVTFAAALLFRTKGPAEAGPRTYYLGTILLALAIGMRPQNLLIGAFPGLRASIRRRPAEIAIAALIGIAITAIAFGSAALATGPERYFAAVRQHAAYISETDSFRSPDRPSLLTMFDRFFLRQHGPAVLSYVVSLFAIIAVFAAIHYRSRPIGRIALTFGPFAILAWLMLDRFSTSRFSMGYVPLFAILAAYGISCISRRAPVELVAGGVLAGAFIVWSWPALSIARTTVAPTVAAVDAARGAHPLYVATAMVPFVSYLAPDLDYVEVRDERALPLGDVPNAWLLAEVDRTTATGRVFRRDPSILRSIVRHRYFETAVEPMTARPRFVGGWEPPKRDHHEEWRCTAGPSTIELPRPSSLRMRLRLMMNAPAAVLADIRLNGVSLEKVNLTGDIVDLQYDVTPGADNLLEIAVPTTARVCVRNLSWGQT